MPRFDGTGPDGTGPIGRGRGRCRAFSGMLQTRRGSAISGAFLTMCGLAVQDAINPKGLTRHMFRSIGRRFRGLYSGRNTGNTSQINDE